MNNPPGDEPRRPMTDNPSVFLSGFADESANSKTAVEQLAVFSALGLRYYSLRFVDVGGGIKNVMKLQESERHKLKQLHEEYDMKVATIGSPIGKVKLADIDDGTNNLYIPFEQYLATDVMHAIELAHFFDTKLIRGFSFYPPKGKSHEPYFAQAVDQLGQIAERCRAEGVVYGLEIEANLIGHTGESLVRIYREVNDPNLVLIFDGGNLACQNLRSNQCFDEYRKMREGIGWMHVKDYRIDPALHWEGYVDEERLRNFVPVGMGDGGYEESLRDFRSHLPDLNTKMLSLGAPGVFLEIEPHLKGGGQFGGFSGPDGAGIALRALCRLLDYSGIEYHLRDYTDLRKPEPKG